jgi:hypothetical protein
VRNRPPNYNSYFFSHSTTVREKTKGQIFSFTDNPQKWWKFPPQNSPEYNLKKGKSCGIFDKMESAEADSFFSIT